MAATRTYKHAAINAENLVVGMRIISPSNGPSPLITSVEVKRKTVIVTMEGLKHPRKYPLASGLMVQNVQARDGNKIRDFQAAVHGLDMIPLGTDFLPHLI